MVSNTDPKQQADRLDSIQLDSSQEKSDKPETETYHHYPSFWLALGSAFFQTVVFAIVIPTSTAYVARLGQGRWFAGGISALAAFVPGILAPVWKRIADKTSLKRCFQILSVFQIIGTFLWTMGIVSNSPYVLLVARLFSGLGSPANCYATYINRAVPQSKKTSAMKISAAIFGSAYAVGALLAFVLTLIGQKFPTGSEGTTVWKLFNQYTYPGWLCCAFYTTYLIMICTLFREPPIPEDAKHGEQNSDTDKTDLEAQAPAKQQEKHRVQWGKLSYLFPLVWSMLSFAFSYTGLFSFTVSIVIKISNLSLLYATLFLAVLMLVNTIATLCSEFFAHIPDRKILLAGYGMLLVVLPLGFVAIDDELVGGLGAAGGSHRVAWGALAVYLLIFATAIALLNVVRAANLALFVKVPDPKDRDAVIAVGPAFTFMMATSVGSMVGLALEAWQMLLIVCLFVASAFVAVLFNYKHLESDYDKTDGTPLDLEQDEDAARAVSQLSEFGVDRGSIVRLTAPTIRLNRLSAMKPQQARSMKAIAVVEEV